VNKQYDHEDLGEVAESIQMECAAEVLGDPGSIEWALAEIGAFVGKNDRGGIGKPREWDAYSLADVRTAEGDFNPDAPSGALLHALFFGDDKTSGRCRYALAARIERALADDIAAAVAIRTERVEVFA
jgi:hypothetical protein